MAHIIRSTSNGTNLIKEDTPSVVCVLNPDDVYSMRKMGQGSESYITPYDVNNLKKAGIYFPDNVHEGSLLMLSRGVEYIKVSKEAEDEIISSRILAIQEIASRLGAKKFSATAECLSKYVEDKNCITRVAANYGGNNGEIKSNNDEKLDKVFSRKESTEAEWVGLSYEKGYECALELAKEKGLIDTNFIGQLISQCNPKNPNRTKRIIYKVDLNSDIIENHRKAYDITAKLDVLPKETGLSIDVDKNYSQAESKKLNLTFEVEFGDVQCDKNEFEVNQTPKNIISSPKRNGAVDETIGGISAQLANYALSADVNEKIAGINEELEKRALSQDVDKKIGDVSAKLADYALSADVNEKIAGINEELEKRAKVESVSILHHTFVRYKKIALSVLIGLGIISISLLIMTIYLYSLIIW